MSCSCIVHNLRDKVPLHLSADTPHKVDLVLQIEEEGPNTEADIWILATYARVHLNTLKDRRP